MPYTTVIRLHSVIRNPGNGFPARLLGQTRPNVEEWKAIAMPDFSSWNITDSGVVLTSEFQGIKEMG